ncbi:hypothetical protein C8J56DRAFT_549192 [Mycena floridula]|nr:hypothetical protein C8J56DRAFT_549192 [Mycena floridula]
MDSDSKTPATAVESPRPDHSIAHSEALAAAELRNRQRPAPELTATQLLAQQSRKQVFRRLIDPGILRPNSKEQALTSLKTLLTICENLLREPDNPKYQQFKPTNNIIKKNLVDPKGALEYAIELGFRPEVVKFQPWYTFNPRRIEDLRIGTVILQEALTLEREKQERASRSKVDEKAVAQAIAEKVKLAFIDDRLSKQSHDAREKQLREARATRAAAVKQNPPPPTLAPEPEGQPMPGSGHVLSTASNPMDDEEDEDDNDEAANLSD